jgi:hypothetical protein
VTRFRTSGPPVLAPGLILVAASVATAVLLRLAGHHPHGFAWATIALVAGFSLSGSV